MTHLRRIAGLLLAMLLALSVVPAFAQDMDDTGEDSPEDFSEFEGIEYSVTRSWTFDYESMSDVTPTDEDEDPFANMTGIFILGGSVYEFDSDDNAEAAFEYFEENGEDSFSSDLDEGVTVEPAEVEDLGDQAMAFNYTSETEGFGETGRVIVVREGQYIFLSVVFGTTEEDAATADEFAQAMVDNLDGQSGLGEFDEAGGSTGGLWDIFPSSDDEMFEGLIPGEDSVDYPEPEDEES